ncbi:MAG: FtsX-like permease family protein [Myxococcales bacterium]
MSLLADLLRMGARNVGRNRRRSLLTGAMVVFAVAGVVFFKGYTLGIRRMMVAGAVESMIGALQIQREGYAEAQELAPLDLDLPEAAGRDGTSLAQRVRAVAGVKAVAPRLRFAGLLGGSDGTTTIVGIGMDPERERDVCPLGMGVRTGSAGSFNALVDGAGLAGEDDGIVVASDLASGLGLKVGDPVTLQVRTRNGSMDTADTVVRGIFRFDDPSGNKLLVLVPLRLAQRLLHMDGRVTAYAVSLHDTEALVPVSAAVQAALAGQTPPAKVHRWTELAAYLRDVIELQDDVFGVVLGVVVMLVVAGVVNTMMMSVYERRREIGTLMSLGFRRRSIVLLFLIEAAWLGLLSAGVGALAGALLVLATSATGLAFAIPSGATILVYPELRLVHVAAAVAAALVGALLAASFPAYRASRLQPIEALRST